MEIKITIKSMGKVEIKTTGFVGEGCKTNTEALKKRLGVVSDTPTAEAFETVQQEAYQR